MASHKAIVLSIDDDVHLQNVVKTYLEDDGYRVVCLESGAQLKEFLPQRFDVALLDLVLPDAEGFELIHKLRIHTNAPIIVVSGKSDTTEKIISLEMGADDYLTKPFEMRELSARIKAALRRVREQMHILPSPANTNKVHFGSWNLDRAQYQVYDDTGRSADLTTGEFQLLEALVMSAGRVLSREQLFDLTRAGNYDSYDRAIDIQIARIRKKIGDNAKDGQLLKTIRGIGYMFTGDTKSF